jgi:hypothetical protein
MVLETLHKEAKLLNTDVICPKRLYLPNSKRFRHFTYGVLNNCLVDKNTSITYITILGSTSNLGVLLGIDKVSFGFAGPVNKSVLAVYDTPDMDMYSSLRECSMVDRCLPLFSIHLSLLSLGYNDSLVDLSKLDGIYDTLQILNYAIENYKTPSRILPPLDSIENS